MMALPDRSGCPHLCRNRAGGPSRHHRRGFNLAELLFVTAAISGLTVLVMTVIASLITAEQHAAEALWVELTVSSFAADLRQDAHQAVDVEVDADAANAANEVTALTLVLPEQTRVTYECTSEGVTRRQTRGEGPEAVETYRLALGSSSFRAPGEDGLLRWVHVRDIPSIGGFTQTTQDATPPQRTFHVVAAVGIHGDADEEQAP
jgi:hypothetical protein